MRNWNSIYLVHVWIPTTTPRVVVGVFILAIAGTIFHLLQEDNPMAAFRLIKLLLRFLARKAVSLWAISILIGVGLSLVSYDYFALSIIALSVASVWGIGAWLSSDFLAKKKPRRNKRQDTKGFEEATHRYQFWKWSSPALICIVLYFACSFVQTRRLERRLAMLKGWLEPGNWATPANICGGDGTAPKGVTMLFLGTHNVVHEVNRFPHTVLLINGRQSLVLDKSTDGRIAPILDIKSPDGKIVVRMNNDDGFVVNPNNALEFRRPDVSSLIVIDQYGREVLNARYLNRQAFKLTGIFTIPGYGSVPLEDPNMGNSCYEMGANGGYLNNDIVINIPRVPGPTDSEHK